MICERQYNLLNPTFSPASGGIKNVRHNSTAVITHGITSVITG